MRKLLRNCNLKTAGPVRRRPPWSGVFLTTVVPVMAACFGSAERQPATDAQMAADTAVSLGESFARPSGGIYTGFDGGFSAKSCPIRPVLSALEPLTPVSMRALLTSTVWILALVCVFVSSRSESGTVVSAGAAVCTRGVDQNSAAGGIETTLSACMIWSKFEHGKILPGSPPRRPSAERCWKCQKKRRSRKTCGVSSWHSSRSA